MEKHTMQTVTQLLKGHQAFIEKYFHQDPTLYKSLQQGQSPVALVVGCADSRADPAIVFNAEPGELFIVRNVANLVPPYQPKFDSYHGVSASLEFGACNLEIPNIIVLGHSQCAGIRALLAATRNKGHSFDSFVESWVEIAWEAKEKVMRDHTHCSVDEQERYCEEEAIKVSLRNLRSFPWIQERLKAGKLALHGWHFDIISGKLFILNEETGEFQDSTEILKARNPRLGAGMVNEKEELSCS